MPNKINRTVVEDESFEDDEQNTSFISNRFVRVSAKEKRFERVNFRFSTFESCYLRKCTFVQCDFTGCKFSGTNLRGSKFSRCTFDYTTFERTVVSDDILEEEAPQRENLKAEFARTLRINYQQLGYAASVNHAIKIELEATSAHLRKAWRSKESYYRDKYVGFTRFEYFVRSSSFETLDFIWGNGESAWKLLRTVLVLFLLMGVWGGLLWGSPLQLESYWSAFKSAPTVFLGTVPQGVVPRWYLTLITAVRFTMFGAFISILTKRLSRR